MDLASSVSGLLEAFSNAEDVDRLSRGGGDLGKTYAKILFTLWMVADVPRSLRAAHRIGKQTDI